jgi:hypothetical protein
MRPYLMFALPVLLLLAACEAVYSPQPIGEEPLPLNVADWQGTWLQGDIVLLTTVLDAEKGILQATWLERYKDGARQEVLTGEVRRSGEAVFFNAIEQPADVNGEGAGENETPGATGAVTPAAPAESPKPLYWWARARLDGSHVTVWWPNVEAFRTAVRAGRLPGTVRDDDHVVLGSLTPEQLALFDAPESGLLDWSNPVVFVRVGD